VPKKIERRNFLKSTGIIGAAAIAGGISAAVNAQTATPGPSLPIVSNRVISHTFTEIEGGREDRAVLEVVGSNGVKEVSEFLRRAVGPHRTTTMRVQRFASEADTVPVSTSIKTILTEIEPGLGSDGKVGNSLTLADESGIRPKRAFRVKPADGNPYDGLSEQEIADKIFAERKLK
jgi:hypothetical protein